MTDKKEWDNDKWKFYKNATNKWEWKRYSSNGIIVGQSVHGFLKKEYCVVNAERHGYKHGISKLK